MSTSTSFEADAPRRYEPHATASAASGPPELMSTACRAARTASTMSVHCWRARSRCRCFKLEYEDALRDAERSLELDPRWVKGHYRAGACLARLCDFAAARDAFLAGAEIDPRNEQIKSALRDVETALEEIPMGWEDAKTRGNASYRDGKYEDAVRWYTRGLEFLESLAPKNENEEETLVSVDVVTSAAFATLLANRAEARRQETIPQEAVVNAVAKFRRALGHCATSDLVRALVQMVTKAYGAAEVRKWSFEVWNVSVPPQQEKLIR